MEKQEKLKNDKQKVEKDIGDTTHPSDKNKGHALNEVRHSRNWALTYGILLLASLGAYYLISMNLLLLSNNLSVLLLKVSRIAIFSFLVLFISRLVDHFFICPVEDESARYNLRQLNKLVSAALIILIFVTIIFVNWYAAAVSIGLISVVLGFALQTPISSLIGWVYILVRNPYRVGDRIKLEDSKGDVIAIGYFDTTLWEFGGDYLSTDHPSGRLIRFPNSKVLDSVVYNYSWDYFPYIWNEARVYIAYDSDFSFVAETMKALANEEIGNEMTERIKVYRDLLSHTAIDQLEVKEEPSVLFKVHDNTWIEAIVRYLVEPRVAGDVKSKLNRKIIEALGRNPEQVRFPKGDSR